MSADPPPPEARVQRRHRWSPVWLIPVAAVGLVVYLLVGSLEERGPAVTITFRTAEGLRANQTQLKHRNVALGTVDDIGLSKDLSHVVVHVRMQRRGASILTDHARFWVVRATLSPHDMTAALETLVSGAHIEVDPGSPGGHRRYAFTGLEQPPGVTFDEPGHIFELRTQQRGSLSVGAPVVYRDTEAGQVLGYKLEGKDGPITVRIAVKAPYDGYVHAATRFWKESGATLGMGPQGVHLELASLNALVSGQISFSTPAAEEGGPPSNDGAIFPLYEDKEHADASVGEHFSYITYLRGSVAGLAAGSPVEIAGVPVGSVSDVRLVVDPQRPDGFAARVSFELRPARALDPAHAALLAPGRISDLVKGGLRVVLATSNLVLGQKDLSLRQTPGAKAADVGEEGGILVLPGDGGEGNDLEAAARGAMRSASGAFDDVQKLARHADSGLAPAFQRLPEISSRLEEATEKVNEAVGEAGYGQDSDFQRNLQELLRQANETARSVRLLSDLLDRHPEALLRGRVDEGK